MPVLVIGIVSARSTPAAGSTRRASLDPAAVPVVHPFRPRLVPLVIRAGLRLKHSTEPSDRSGDCAPKRIPACPRLGLPVTLEVRCELGRQGH